MSHDALLLLLRWAFAVGAVGVVALTIVRPLLRVLRQKPDTALDIPDFASRLEEDELEIPSEEEGGFDRHAAIAQARSDPRAAALLVQRWLKERR